MTDNIYYIFYTIIIIMCYIYFYILGSDVPIKHHTNKE
jgi:hypothetical protein